MGDAGEGLIDAQSKLQELREEREEERRRRAARPVPDNPEQARLAQSLELARTELQRQAAATENPVRREQIAQALAEIERRIAAVG